MGKRARQPNRKRQCKLDDNGPRPPQRKSQRLLAKMPSSTKITDLNDDCLMNIFERLDMGSLFNVAVANEYLRPAAGIVYKRKLGKNTVVISKKDDQRSDPFVNGSLVHIINLKMVLQYLRCLGSSISHLCIYYHGWNAKQCDHIHQYLNQYCAETLVSIRFRGNPAGKPTIERIEKPFVNVRAVEVYESDVGEQLSSFLEWFPNLRSLSLDYVYVDPRCSIDIPLPHLVDVNIELLNWEHDFVQNFTTHLLQQCPQLHSLKFCSRSGEEVNLKAILKIVEGRGRNIRSLKVNIFRQNEPIFPSDIQLLVDAHPSLVQLELYGYEFSVPAVQLLIRQLDSLEQFQFKVPSRLMYDDLVPGLDNRWRSSFDETWCWGNIVKLERSN